MIRNLIVRLAILLLVVGVVAAGAGYWYFQNAIAKPLHLSQPTFEIQHGETLNRIADRLVAEGAIDEPWTLRILGRQKGKGDIIHTGEYRFPDGVSLGTFFEHITQGKGQVDVRVTILEGWTFKQMRQAFAKATKLKQETTGWDDTQIMTAIGHPELHPEGQFYPDTYYYRANESDLTLYKKSFSLMQEKLAEAWDQRNTDMVLKSPYEVLIMASIIEKESQVRDEQPIISGVFTNRLNKGMRLQTDPTVIYGIGDAYQGNITRKHLRTDTPYNTYTRAGLTPTPISLPGNDALLAAVKPAQTKAYYFVAKGGGRHHFSKTLAEHNNAVKKYILGK